MLPGTDSEFRELCRQNNWKCTAQRRAVSACLCGNSEHPNVEAIWLEVRKTLPDVSLDSIYRILDEFVSVGLLRRLENNRVMRYDTNTCRHDHFICSRCGRMFDFQADSMKKPPIQCNAFGTPESYELQVRGVCKDCQRDSRKPCD